MIPAQCPRCAYEFDAATVVHGFQDLLPRAGDLSLCISCAAPMEYREDGGPRWLTTEEFGELPGVVQGEIARAALAILMLRPSRITYQALVRRREA